MFCLSEYRGMKKYCGTARKHENDLERIISYNEFLIFELMHKLYSWAVFHLNVKQIGQKAEKCGHKDF